jgi:mitochondrial fusion and transport protein UGO1
VSDLSAKSGKEVEYERVLRKTAQRGVVTLFNAIRASQVKAEEAARGGGTTAEREERIKEMSKEGFLNLIKSGK